jgi:hypothetical protein
MFLKTSASEKFDNAKQITVNMAGAASLLNDYFVE